MAGKMVEGTEIRLVRCPKCANVLPELPNYPVYQCGGCGATLQSKSYKALLEKRKKEEKVNNCEEEKCSNSSHKVEKQEEEEEVNSSNSIDVSSLHVPIECTNQDCEVRDLGQVEEEEISNVKLEVGIKDDSFENGVVGLVEIKKSPNNKDDGFINNDALLRRNRQTQVDELRRERENFYKVRFMDSSAKSRLGGIDRNHGEDENIGLEISRFQGDRVVDSHSVKKGGTSAAYNGLTMGDSPLKHVNGGMSSRVNPDEGPSDYHREHAYLSDEMLTNSGGGNRVELLEHDRMELLRKLDELRDQLARSGVGDVPRDWTPMNSRRSRSPFQGSVGAERANHPRQDFGRRPYYLNQEAGVHVEEDMRVMMGRQQRLGVHHMVDHPSYAREDLMGYDDLYNVRASAVPMSHQHPQYPRYPVARQRIMGRGEEHFYSRDRLERDVDPLMAYGGGSLYQRPPCSCLNCMYQLIGSPSRAPTAFSRDQQASVPVVGPVCITEGSDHGIRGSRELGFGPSVHAYQGRRQNYNLFSNDPLLDELNHVEDLDAGSTVVGNSPIAGGAPFVSCCSCMQVLKLPKKFDYVNANPRKVRCGSCSKVTLIVLDHWRLRTSMELDKIDRNDGPEIFQVPLTQSTLALQTDEYSKNAPKDLSSNSSAMNRDVSSEAPISLAAGEKTVDRIFPHVQLDLSQKEPPSDKNATMKDVSSAEPIDHSEDAHIHEIEWQHELSPDSLQNGEESQVLASAKNTGVLQSEKPPSKSSSASTREASPSILSRDSSKHFEDGPFLSLNSFNDITLSLPAEKPMEDATESSPRMSDFKLSGEMEALQQKGIKDGDSLFSNFIKKSFKDFSRANLPNENERGSVYVNGHTIPIRLIKKAERMAGPIQYGDYWYDYRAGFWGIMGQPCSGIIPPKIEQFHYPLARDCSGGNTGVLVNGRELHQKDLDLLSSRGLPNKRNKSYIIEISGKVVDEESKKEFSLGKLAPTIEKLKRGFGMRVPKILS